MQNNAPMKNNENNENPSCQSVSDKGLKLNLSAQQNPLKKHQIKRLN